MRKKRHRAHSKQDQAQPKCPSTAPKYQNAHSMREQTRLERQNMHSKHQHKIRLDDLLVSCGEFATREEVERAVIAHEVRVGDVYATSAAMLIEVNSVETSDVASKAGAMSVHDSHDAQVVSNARDVEDVTDASVVTCTPSVRIEVKHARKYVSRGGIKLEGALREFSQDVKSFHCLDIGSSTGGFTDCLLQHGAKSVVALDVNYGQLAWKLRQDAHVTPLERTNIRTVDPTSAGAPFDLLVADLSFIGLSSLASTFAQFCKAGSVLIVLVKPQFESKQGEAEGGLVTSNDVRERCVREVQEALRVAGFDVTHTTQSSIRGKKRGNVEYLVRAVFVG